MSDCERLDKSVSGDDDDDDDYNGMCCACASLQKTILCLTTMTLMRRRGYDQVSAMLLNHPCQVCHFTE